MPVASASSTIGLAQVPTPDLKSLIAEEVAALCTEAGLRTILVLTGTSTRELAERFPYRPSRIVDSVADLIDSVYAPATA